MTDKNTTGRNSLTYKDAGVDIDAGGALVRRIAPFARATARPGSDAELGGFGGLFDLKAAGFKDPVLVASTDGVGTKLKIAIEHKRLGGIGQDLVAMCVNDIVVQGAEPLFFLDYYASGRLDVDSAALVVQGIARACKEAGCVLLGGETAEMPGLYASGDFDLAGFAVGAAEREKILPEKNRMQASDAVIGVQSSGLHSNGFSLVRRIVAESGKDYASSAPFKPSSTLGDALLTPTALYVKSALHAVRDGQVSGLAHITGGGITENLPRVLATDIDAEIDLSSWRPDEVFCWLAKQAGIDEREMLRTFNCGVGLIAIAPAEFAERVIEAFAANGQRAWRMGSLRQGSGGRQINYTGSLRL